MLSCPPINVTLPPRSDERKTYSCLAANGWRSHRLTRAFAFGAGLGMDPHIAPDRRRPALAWPTTASVGTGACSTCWMNSSAGIHPVIPAATNIRISIQKIRAAIMCLATARNQPELCAECGKTTNARESRMRRCHPENARSRLADGCRRCEARYTGLLKEGGFHLSP